MYRFICQICGTECSTPKPGITPTPIHWDDGHSCLFIPFPGTNEAEIIKLQAEVIELRIAIDDIKRELTIPGETNTMLPSLQVKIDKHEQMLTDLLGDKILKNYG